MFTDGPHGKALLASKCKVCGQVFFPKTKLCMGCLHEEMDEIALSRRGKLFTFTVVHMPAANFQPPYAVGFVDLPEGVRIFSQLDLLQNKSFRVDMEMELKVDTLWQEEDKKILGYRFSAV